MMVKLLLVMVSSALVVVIECEDSSAQGGEHHHIEQPKHDPRLHNVDGFDDGMQRRTAELDANGYPFNPAVVSNDPAAPKQIYADQTTGGYRYALG